MGSSEGKTRGTLRGPWGETDFDRSVTEGSGKGSTCEVEEEVRVEWFSVSGGEE